MNTIRAWQQEHKIAEFNANTYELIDIFKKKATTLKKLFESEEGKRVRTTYAADVRHDCIRQWDNQKRKKCVLCLMRGQYRKTAYICDCCLVPLCPINKNDGNTMNCFRFWHSSDKLPDKEKEKKKLESTAPRISLILENTAISTNTTSNMNQHSIRNINNKRMNHKNESEWDYFKSYGHIDIHEDMLKDTHRTLAYKEAIFNHDFNNKVVLDVGCGTGILSLFAADAGAKKVYAVDASDMADMCYKIVKRNNKEKVIKVIKGRIEDIELDDDFVDIIISEWMGYFLVYESMLNSVIYARDKWLKKDGLILPSIARLYMTPFTYDEYYNEHIRYWCQVYGYNFVDMLPMACKTHMDQVVVDEINVENIISHKPKCILEINVKTIKQKDLQEWKNDFAFQSMLSCNFHGFATWFEVEFPPIPFNKNYNDIPNDSNDNSIITHQMIKRQKKCIILSTNPEASKTHWGQTLFFADNPMLIMQDEDISGSIQVKENKKNNRFLDIDINWSIRTSNQSNKNVQTFKKHYLMN